MIKHKANVNAKDNENTTPLHLAAEKDQLKLAEILVAAKAEIDAKDKNGVTPFCKAHEKGNVGFEVNSLTLL